MCRNASNADVRTSILETLTSGSRCRALALPACCSTGPSDSTLPRTSRSPPDHVDLVQLGPVLARHIDLARGRVVRDAGEHVVAAARRVRIDIGEIDPAEHAAVGRRDACDPVVVPDVRPDFTLDALELVELRDRLVAVVHGDLTLRLERHGIEETKRRRAVAHDEMLAVVR